MNASIFVNQKGGKYQSDESAQNLDLKNLFIGQDIYIKIKSIKYEQNNDLFLVASFVKPVE